MMMYLRKEHAEVLKKEGVRFEIMEEDEHGLVSIRMNNVDSLTLHNIFWAGYQCGLNKMSELIKQ